MKPWLTGLLAHFGLPTQTLAQGWRVTRRDTQVFGWTDFDDEVIVEGVTYLARTGLQVTTAHSTDDFAVNTMDVTAFLDVSTEEEMAAEVWDNAEVLNFEFNWSDVPTVLDATTVNILRYGHLGPIKRQDNQFTAEIRGLAQQLTTRIGRAYSPTCPWRHAIWNGSTYVASTECALVLTTLIKTGTVSGLGTDPRREFSDSGQAQAAGYFNAGLITMTSGDNAGITRDIDRWENGQFTLTRPFPRAVQAGDTYSAVRGDDKTWDTCKALGNYLHFGGMPYVPGQAAVFRNPTQV